MAMARRTAMGNLSLMAVPFSLNHAAAVAELNISILLLGSNGAYQSGTLYITYALSALLLSSGVVEELGARRSLIFGAALYCVYVFSLPLALLASSDALELALAIIGGWVGGAAAGLLWVAQGSYFALNAKRHAAERGMSLEGANHALASVFASIFLSIEVALKLLPLALNGVGGAFHVGNKVIQHRDMMLALIFSALAAVSVIGLTRIEELSEQTAPADAGGRADERPDANADAISDAITGGVSGANSGPSSGIASDERGGGDVEQHVAPPSLGSSAAVTSSASEEPLLPPKRARCRREARALGATLRLCWRRPAVLLLNGIPFTFGVCAALLAVAVTGGIVQSAFGESAVLAGSLLSVLVALTAALLQLPFKALGSRVGKAPLMLLGLGGFLSLSLLVYLRAPRSEGGGGSEGGGRGGGEPRLATTHLVLSASRARARVLRGDHQGHLRRLLPRGWRRRLFESRLGQRVVERRRILRLPLAQQGRDGGDGARMLERGHCWILRRTPFGATAASTRQIELLWDLIVIHREYQYII